MNACRRAPERTGRLRRARRLLEIVGPPDFMTDCPVTGDLAALQAGHATDLLRHARVSITDEISLFPEAPGIPLWRRARASRSVIVTDDFRPDVSVDDVSLAIANRARRQDRENHHPRLRAATRLPIKDPRDMSERGRYWLVVPPGAGRRPSDGPRPVTRHLRRIRQSARYVAPTARRR